jgi:hypothetical protein
MLKLRAVSPAGLKEAYVDAWLLFPFKLRGKKKKKKTAGKCSVLPGLIS